MPVMTQQPPKEKLVKLYQKGMENCLDQIEEIWLENGKKKYIAGGDALSIADIVACCELEQPTMAGLDNLKPSHTYRWWG